MLPEPIVEYYLKSDSLGDPMVTLNHIIGFDWADEVEMERMYDISLRINDFLSGLFLGRDIKLVDFKLEFGRLYDEDGGEYLILADEISPDNCRLWDVESGKKLDKDRFRNDLGGVEKAYQEVARRLGLLSDNNVEDFEPKEKRNIKKIGKKKTIGD